MRDLSRGGEALSLDDCEREEEAEGRGNGLALLRGAPAHFRIPDGGTAEPLRPSDLAPLVAAALSDDPRPLRALIALSGGPDSVSLLLACAEARDTFAADGVTFRAATVDHGLRGAAAVEARFCAELAARHGLPHEILPWDGRHGGNLPAAARQARYRLLEDAALRAGCAAILTGHHRDDQIETHLLSLRRGAGPLGLAGMRSRRALAPGLWLVRPFLGIPGARLRAGLRASGQVAVEDPSNRDPVSARARLRQTLLDDPDARHAALESLAAHARERDETEARLAAALDAATGEGLLALRPDGALLVADRLWRQLDAAGRFQWARRIVWALSGAEAPPEGGLIGRVVETLGTAGFRGATLAGTRLRRAPGGLIAIREFGRTGPVAVEVPPATGRVLFDGRYEIAGPVPAGAARVEAFGSGGATFSVLPVLRNRGREILAGHPALLARLPDGTPALTLSDRLAWRLFRDLPAAENLAAQLLETIGADSRLGAAPNPPRVVGKPRVSTYLRSDRPAAAERGPQDDG